MGKDNDSTTANPTQSISIRTLSIIMGIIAVVLSIACLLSIGSVSSTYDDFAETNEALFTCQSAANDMAVASDLLTSEVRIYVSTQDPQHLEHYFAEVNVTKRRDNAVAVLDTYLGDTSARSYLNQALDASNELMLREEYAMRLVVEATELTLPDYASALEGVELTAADAALSRNEKIERAQQIVFDSVYQHYDDLIEQSVTLCKNDLLDRMGEERERELTSLDHSLLRLELCIALIVVDFLVTLVGFAFLVLKPIYSFVHRIEKSEPLDDAGSSELRYLSSTYNAMYEESRRTHERLKRKSELDGLTGIYNRNVFDQLLVESASKAVALLLIDVDNFKDVNDSYGHVVGDRVLQKVAALLEHTFRQSDFPCRVGGDEFAVLMMGVNVTMESVVIDKIATIRAALLDVSDGLPAITLSIGVAFGPLEEEEGDETILYKRADEALYDVKESGRNAYRFWK